MAVKKKKKKKKKKSTEEPSTGEESIHLWLSLIASSPASSGRISHTDK